MRAVRAVGADGSHAHEVGSLLRTKLGQQGACCVEPQIPHPKLSSDIRSRASVVAPVARLLLMCACFWCVGFTRWCICSHVGVFAHTLVCLLAALALTPGPQKCVVHVRASCRVLVPLCAGAAGAALTVARRPDGCTCMLSPARRQARHTSGCDLFRLARATCKTDLQALRQPHNPRHQDIFATACPRRWPRRST